MVAAVQNNSSAQIQESASSAPWFFTKPATDMIKALGLILVAVGTLCIVAGIHLPPIALLVMGAAALVFGFVAPKSEEVIAPLEIPAPTNLASTIAFGREQWLQYICNPRVVPALPQDIEAILAAPCPFWAAKTVAQTHILVLVPGVVTRMVEERSVTEPYTLRSQIRIMQGANQGRGPSCEIEDEILREFGDAQSLPHWVLMTKEIVPGTGQRDTIQADIDFLASKGYEIPSCRDASTAILLENLRSEEPIFGIANSRELYTGFQEYTCQYEAGKGVTYGYIGGFSRNRLSIEIKSAYLGYERPGFAGVRVFY